jgi:lipopolysaccharide transport system ATP-binding protein
MSAVESLCDRVIWLDEGRIAGEGNPRDVIASYLKKTSVPVTERLWSEQSEAPGTSVVRIRKVCVRPSNGLPADPITRATPFVIEIEYWNLSQDARFHLMLNITNEHGTLIFRTSAAVRSDGSSDSLPRGLFHDVCHVPAHLLNVGIHKVELIVAHDHVRMEFRKTEIILFEVLEPDTRKPWQGTWHGAVRPNLEWTSEQITERPA